MKILVTGSKGQLGSELRALLEECAPGMSTYIDIEDLDLSDEAATARFLRNGEFSHIVNCAAFTAVDKAEECNALCHAANVTAVSNIARLADELDLKILHISTDYVFDGNTNRPYNESAKPEPQSVYGASKRKGETALLGLSPSAMIIRTGWLYSVHGHNFVKTMLKAAGEGRRLRVVVDQVGTPTNAADLAAAIVHILLKGPWTPGIFHYSNEGVCSWYDFAVAVLEAAGMDEAAAAVTPIPTSDYPTAATRPYYSVLDKSKIRAVYGLKIPHWRKSLQGVVARLTGCNK